MGGLGILWDPTRVILGGLHGRISLLLADFKVVGFSIKGIITNFYGTHNPSERRDFIKYLWKAREQAPSSHWIVGGDFNIITSLEEKKSGRRKVEGECEKFRGTIEELALVYIIP